MKVDNGNKADEKFKNLLKFKKLKNNKFENLVHFSNIKTVSKAAISIWLQ